MVSLVKNIQESVLGKLSISPDLHSSGSMTGDDVRCLLETVVPMGYNQSK